jgi:molecular chaperone DnaK (HSP70)
MTEPEAAATHYARRMRLSRGDLVAVYDLGGGTFDTTVAQTTATGITTVGAPEGIEWVGGADFDAAIFTHVDRTMNGAYSALDRNDPAAAIALDRIRLACVQAKETLSREEAATIPVMLPYRHTQVRITRNEFESMIRPAITSTLEAVGRSMKSAGVAPEDLAAVLLVGGSSRIPLVSRMLSQELGRPVLIDRHPQHCVALGAATVAGAALPRIAADEPANTAVVRRRLATSAVAAAVILGGALAFGDSRSAAPPTSVFDPGAPAVTSTTVASLEPVSDHTVPTLETVPSGSEPQDGPPG